MRKVILAISVGILTLVGTTFVLPFEQMMELFPVYVVLASAGWLTILLLGEVDEESAELLEAMMDSDYWQARKEVTSRLPVAVVLFGILALQILMASGVFTTAQNRQLSSALAVGPLEIGVFEMLLWVVIGWLLGPLAKVVFKRVLETIWRAVQDRRDSPEAGDRDA